MSPKGASGVMQVMPANYKSLGITDPNDPRQSIEGAAKLYTQLLSQYDGDVGAAMAHYNGGNKSGKRYQEGKALNSETAEYIEYAAPYLESVGKPSKYAQSITAANDVQLGGLAPSDLPLPQDYETGEGLAETLNEKFERELQEEQKFFNLSLDDALRYGYKQTLTAAIGHAWDVKKTQISSWARSNSMRLNDSSLKAFLKARSNGYTIAVANPTSSSTLSGLRATMILQDDLATSQVATPWLVTPVCSLVVCSTLRHSRSEHSAWQGEPLKESASERRLREVWRKALLRLQSHPLQSR